MIIQCKQCRTKFRFDDAQMQGDGLWMRCSRCQHVFFQDNLTKIIRPAGTAQTVTVSPQEADPEKTVSRLSFEPADIAHGGTTPDEDVASFLHKVKVPEKTVSDELKPESKPADNEKRLSLDDIEVSPSSEDLDETGELQEPSEETPVPPVRKKGKLWKAVLWAILVIVVIPAIVYFVMFPKLGERYIQIARKYVGASQAAKNQDVTGFVKLQDIRQRNINNYILGNLRILEGTAVNQADFSIARILLKGEILDAYAVVLGEQSSYAGNVLTDEELTNMSEEDIMKRLSEPAGRDNLNDRVVPNGLIPFMIVFTREPPGAIKTTVMIAAAERLL